MREESPNKALSSKSKGNTLFLRNRKNGEILERYKVLSKVSEHGVFHSVMDSEVN